MIHRKVRVGEEARATLCVWVCVACSSHVDLLSLPVLPVTCQCKWKAITSKKKTRKDQNENITQGERIFLSWKNRFFLNLFIIYDICVFISRVTANSTFTCGPCFTTEKNKMRRDNVTHTLHTWWGRGGRHDDTLMIWHPLNQLQVLQPLWLRSKASAKGLQNQTNSRSGSDIFKEGLQSGLLASSAWRTESQRRRVKAQGHSNAFLLRPRCVFISVHEITGVCLKIIQSLN